MCPQSRELIEGVCASEELGPEWREPALSALMGLGRDPVALGDLTAAWRALGMPNRMSLRLRTAHILAAAAADAPARGAGV